MKASELVEKYIKLRDKKGEMKKEYEDKVSKLEQALDKIETVLLNTLNTAGIDSIKTEFGTAYTATRSSATVADRDGYFGWIQEDLEERMIFLEARANKTAVQQYKEVHGELPPGINWREERVLNIRRG
jgi:hypothetical protein